MPLSYSQVNQQPNAAVQRRAQTAIDERPPERASAATAAFDGALIRDALAANAFSTGSVTKQHISAAECFRGQEFQF